jgi:prevent-host-death family protein
MRVTVHQAKTQLSKLIAAAEAGEEVIIARGDTPVAKLVPLEAAGKAPRRAGRLKGQFEIAPDAFAPMSEEELRDWGMVD